MARKGDCSEGGSRGGNSLEGENTGGPEREGRWEKGRQRATNKGEEGAEGAHIREGRGRNRGSKLPEQDNLATGLQRDCASLQCVRAFVRASVLLFAYPSAAVAGGLTAACCLCGSAVETNSAGVAVWQGPERDPHRQGRSSAPKGEWELEMGEEGGGEVEGCLATTSTTLSLSACVASATPVGRGTAMHCRPAGGDLASPLWRRIGAGFGGERMSGGIGRRGEEDWERGRLGRADWRRRRAIPRSNSVCARALFVCGRWAARLRRAGDMG